jgi:hypothetical protein
LAENRWQHRGLDDGEIAESTLMALAGAHRVLGYEI